MSAVNGWAAEPASSVSNYVIGRRAKSGPFVWLVLACAGAMALSGCDTIAQGRYRHWQGQGGLADPANGIDGHSPGPLVDEWLYTGDGFEGTFIQPNEDHRTWPMKQWRREMADLRHVGFDTIIIQWAEYDDEDYMAPDGDGMSLVERIVAAADEADIDVYVGLSLRGAWWDSRNITMRFMRGEFARNKRAVEWLYPRLEQYKSFRGWYIPHEVCDLYYTYDQRLLVLTFYKELTAYLNRVDPLKTVMASGYTDHDASSLLQFTKWYKMFMEDSGVDILIFQDGAGLSGRTEWRNILPYADALVGLRKKEFRGDIWLLAEIFTQTAGPPLNNRSFAAEPAEFARIREQLDALGMMGTKLIVYSYFTYMRPSAGKQEAALYESYRQYISEKISRITESPAQ